MIGMRVSVRVIPREAPRVRSTSRGIPGDGVAKLSDSGAGRVTPASGESPCDDAAIPSDSGAGHATRASGGNPDGGATNPCGSEADRVMPTRRQGSGRCSEWTTPFHLAAVHRGRRSIAQIPETGARVGVVRRLLVVEFSIQIALQIDSLITN